MPQPPSRPAASPLPRLAQAVTIARLQQIGQLAPLDPIARAVIGAIRLLAVNSRLGRDPLPDLVQRFVSIEAARAFIAFADRVGTCWPERVQVLRPCCGLLSPDEATIAALVSAAAAGERLAFTRQIEGFVRPDRHDALFDLAVRLVASLQDSGTLGADHGLWR